MTRHGQGRGLHGIKAGLGFDMIGDHVDRPVVGEVITIDLHQSGIGTFPGPHGRPPRTHHDHGFGAGQDIVGPVALGHELIPPRHRRHANHVAADIQGQGLEGRGEIAVCPGLVRLICCHQISLRSRSKLHNHANARLIFK
jgi:hypothetical protein